jgi:hypothetical protein
MKLPPCRVQGGDLANFQAIAQYRIHARFLDTLKKLLTKTTSGYVQQSKQLQVFFNYRATKDFPRISE